MKNDFIELDVVAYGVIGVSKERMTVQPTSKKFQRKTFVRASLIAEITDIDETEVPGARAAYWTHIAGAVFVKQTREELLLMINRAVV